MTLEKRPYKEIVDKPVSFEFVMYLNNKIDDMGLKVTPNFSSMTTAQVAAIQPIGDKVLYSLLYKNDTSWPNLKKQVYRYVKAYNCFWPEDPTWPKEIDYVPAWGNRVRLWKEVKEKLDKNIKPLCSGIIPLKDLDSGEFEWIPF